MAGLLASKVLTSASWRTPDNKWKPVYTRASKEQTFLRTLSGAAAE